MYVDELSLNPCWPDFTPGICQLVGLELAGVATLVVAEHDKISIWTRSLALAS